MAKPKDTVWPIEPHTLAKHQILRKYIDAWLPIMSKYYRRLVYVDGFSGPGVYAGGEPGSPIVALRALLDHPARERILAKTEVVYAFIEERPDRCERLRQEVARLGNLPKNVTLRVWEGVYEEVFGRVLAGLEELGQRLAPTFAFVDPFGYAQASMHLSGTFLQFGRCEALIYVPLSFIARFVGREGQESALTSLFGCERWREAIDLDGEARRAFLHDLFRDQLHEVCGLKYVRSFEIQTADRNAGYHLFFGTNELLGLERMKDSMWSVDRVAGTSYRDSTMRGQGLLFEPKPDLRPLAAALRERFGLKPFSIEQAEEFTLVETPYRKALHLKTETLKPLEKAGDLVPVEPPSGRRKGSFPAGTKMRFTR